MTAALIGAEGTVGAARGTAETGLLLVRAALGRIRATVDDLVLVTFTVFGPDNWSTACARVSIRWHATGALRNAPSGG
jgi:hypothetical protein